MKAKKEAKDIKQKSSVGKWLLIFVLLAVGIAADYHYSQVAWAIRAAIGLVWLIILIALALLTSQGKKAWNYVKAARNELRKVTWPTRQETIQMTLIVVAMVIIIALILWGVDAFFLWGVRLLTGQGG